MENQVWKTPEETEEEYRWRLYSLKECLGLTWNDLADIINDELNCNYSADKYRKDYSRHYSNRENIPNSNGSMPYTLDEIKCERKKLADERTQINSLYRRLAREDTIKSMAKDAAATINSSFRLPSVKTRNRSAKNEAILEISDWHYGIEIENPWNVYSPDIAKQRIANLRDQVVEKIKENDIHTLHIVNLGDLIAGRIHLQLRINSQFDVVTQIIQVSELLAEFISDLSAYAEIHYYDCLDNHSRLEPLKENSLELESLARITTWYLKERLDTRIITIHENEFGDDIITFNILGHEVCGVHGHHDKPSKVVDNMTLMTKRHYDLVLTAHLHHFSADEKNQTVVVSNSSLMGTDEYAEKLRLSASPAQNLIVVTKENPVEAIFRLVVD